MTTIAIPRSDNAPGPSVPRLSPAFLKSAVKLGVTMAIFAGVVATAYLVLPRLEATGIWAYGVGFLIQATTAASIIVPIPGMAALVVESRFEGPGLLARQPKLRRAPADRSVVAAGRRAAQLGEEPGQVWLSPRTEGKLDDLAVREQVPQEGLDRVEVVGAAQVEEQHAQRPSGVRCCGPRARHQTVWEKTGFSSLFRRR